MADLRVPSVESVERLYGISGSTDQKYSRTLLNPQSTPEAGPLRTLKVIAKEASTPVTGSGLSQVATTFTCEIVKRQNDGTLVASGTEIEVWNDFADTIPLYQMMEVVKDPHALHYKIVVLYC